MQLTLTWGWKHEEERKAKTEREGETERRLVRADRCCSAGRRRRWWGVNNLSVWKRRSTVNQGGRRGTYGNLRCAPQYTRTTGVTARHYKIRNTQWKCIVYVWTHSQTQSGGRSNSSDYIKTFLLTQSAALDWRTDVVLRVNLQQNHRRRRDNT